MTHKIDARTYRPRAVERSGFRSAASDHSPLTGNPRRLSLENQGVRRGLVTTDPIAEAKELLTEAAPALGLAARSTDTSFVADPKPLRTSSGGLTVHLQQYYQGIPVFDMTRTVRFDSTNAPAEILGDSIELPAALSPEPRLLATEAVALALRELGEPESAAPPTRNHWGQAVRAPQLALAGRSVTVRAPQSGPELRTLLEVAQLPEPVIAHLTYLYLNPSTHLCWQLTVTMPDRATQYVVLVGADEQKSGQILYLQRTSSHHVAGFVYARNPGETPRAKLPFPPARTAYPEVPWTTTAPSFPRPWAENDHTLGDSVLAVRGDSGESLMAQLVDGELVFAAEATDTPSALLSNAFYACNYLHDFYYLLGFDEAAGNFQTEPGKSGDDRVLVRVYEGEVDGTANMLTRADGQGAVLCLGLVAGTGRHTALDADVVFHEYTHGVSNRLVGGPANDRALLQPQSSGMGEGWSDYFAITLQNYFRAEAAEKFTSGTWLLNNQGGVRAYTYDASFPDNFGSIDSGRYKEDEHNVGEVFGAVLIALNRALGRALHSRQRGHQVGWQLVIDGMKLCAANPSFLDARSGIVAALDDMKKSQRLTGADYILARRAMWETFAHFGMGLKARCAGARLEGIVADFDLPPDLVAPVRRSAEVR